MLQFCGLGVGFLHLDAQPKWAIVTRCDCCLLGGFVCGAFVGGAGFFGGGLQLFWV